MLHLLRFSQLWLTIQVFLTLCCTTTWVFPDVSKDQSACIFMVMQFQKLLHPEDEGTMIPSNVRWNYSSTNIMSHTGWFQRLTAMRFSRFFKVSSEKLWSTFTPTQSLPLLHHPVIYIYPTNYKWAKYRRPIKKCNNYNLLHGQNCGKIWAKTKLDEQSLYFGPYLIEGYYFLESNTSYLGRWKLWKCRQQVLQKQDTHLWNYIPSHSWTPQPQYSRLSKPCIMNCNSTTSQGNRLDISLFNNTLSFALVTQHSFLGFWRKNWKE
jgi:hypothetical protein